MCRDPARTTASDGAATSKPETCTSGASSSTRAGCRSSRRPSRRADYAARVEIQPGDLWPNGLNRVEVEYKPLRATLAEGQESCFAWRFFLPAALSEARHQIGYWESYPSYKQIMSFEVRGQGIAFVTRMPSERVHWTAPAAVTPNVWHQIAMCARWSTDPAVGFVDVWFDKQKVVNHGAARTLWDNPNFVQIGILRDVPGPPEVMFLDDAMEASVLDPDLLSAAGPQRIR